MGQPRSNTYVSWSWVEWEKIRGSWARIYYRDVHGVRQALEDLGSDNARVKHMHLKQKIRGLE